MKNFFTLNSRFLVFAVVLTIALTSAIFYYSHTSNPLKKILNNPIGTVNSNITTYATVDECARHANTSQKCVQVETQKGIRWKVFSNENVSPQQTPLPVIITRSCAPWGGEAFWISMSYEGGIFNAQIFGEGLTTFRKNDPVIIDESGRTFGTGLANFCVRNDSCIAYKKSDVTIQIPSSIIGATSTLPGRIIIKGRTIPVEARWRATQSLCR